jgi:ABC-type ATPase with predicted acetyltransferase domain
MSTYSISKSFPWRGKITDRVASVCKMFGLTIKRLAGHFPVHSCRLDINPGDIVYITGPSGAGKSVLLTELQKQFPPEDIINLADIELSDDKTVIDCLYSDELLSADVGLLTGLQMLSTAGLSDCFCILNQPVNLSEGEKYRFRLAMALAAEKKFVFADEFCSELDRITAASVSYKIREFADKNGTTFILASSHEDILLDLAPDVLVTKHFAGKTDVVYKKSRR